MTGSNDHFVAPFSQAEGDQGCKSPKEPNVVMTILLIPDDLP